MEIAQQGINWSLDQMTGGNKTEIRIGQMRGRRKVKYEDGSTVERGQESNQFARTGSLECSEQRNRDFETN